METTLNLPYVDPSVDLSSVPRPLGKLVSGEGLSTPSSVTHERAMGGGTLRPKFGPSVTPPGN